MSRHRSRWTDLLTRTLLRLLAVAGLFALLPSLPRPAPGRALASPPVVAAPRAELVRASAQGADRGARLGRGALSRPAASGPRLR